MFESQMMENSGYFNEVLKQQLDYIKNSGINVDYDSAFCTVDIYDDQGGSIFMQGEEASEWIDSVENAAENRFFNESEYDVALLMCYGYTDLLAEG